MKKFTTICFGCKVNSYEIEAIKEKMIQRGYIYTENDFEADIFIVNSCAVTQVAEKKVMEKLRSINRNFPNAKIAIMGCFSQLHPEKILSLNNVQILLGTKNRMNLVEYLDRDEPVIDVDKFTRKFSFEACMINSFEDSRPFVKIQDGCDNFCTYCVIPLVRGKSRSRNKLDILNEISNLAKNGYREIVLTGIDMGSYSFEGDRLTNLVEDILNLDEKDFRLRISSLEASQVDDRLIEIMSTNPRLVPHVHLPLQSGSKKISHLMGRKYDMDGFYNLVNKLKSKVKNIALSTDVITGFPNEDETDFLDTYNFIQQVEFMRLHVFPYSRRPNTLAYNMENQVDRGISKQRVRRLNKLGDELARKYYLSYLGKSLQLLVDSCLGHLDNDPTKPLVFAGYTQNYIPLKVISKGDISISSLLNVKIEDKEILTNYQIADKFE